MAAEFVGIAKGAIDLSDQEERLENGTEIGRLWIQNAGPGHFFINAYKMAEAGVFGMMITDTIRAYTTELNTIDPGERIH